MAADTQKLTVSREVMVAHIEQAGGSVLVNGTLITRTANLPTVADFAAKSGNPVEIDKALDSLDAALAAIQAQKDALLAKGNTPAPAAAPAQVKPLPDMEKPLPDMQQPSDLLKLSFSQALTVAAEQNVEDIDSYETKADLVDAILVKSGYPPLQGRTDATQNTDAGQKPPVEQTPKEAAPAFLAPAPVAPLIVETAEVVSDGTLSQDEVVARLGSLTVDQLKAVATEAKVENVSSLAKKQDLIDAIVAKSAEQS